MKICLTSDTHIGLTKPETLRKMFKKMATEEFDVLIHAGDYCGGLYGGKSVKTTVKMIRKEMPDVPFLSVIGNHDYWYAGRRGKNVYGGLTYQRPSLSQFNRNYESIVNTFKEYDVHFLDEDGPYSYLDVIIAGVSGWYNHPHPPTNDEGYLPFGIEGHTNRWMEKRARNKLFEQLEALDASVEPHHTVAFVSHFPVVNVGDDHKGSFHIFCWDENIAQEMQFSYKCKHFFCGHAHRYHNGPLRYESGSDYYNPKYLIVEI